MSLLRLPILAAVAAVLMVGNLVYWIFFHNSGVTLTFKQAPLAEVIRAFERQAPVKVQTNIDPSTPVTIFVKNVPWPDALETLAVASEGRWYPAYVLAPSRTEAREAIAEWSGGSLPEGWSRYQPGGGGGGGGWAGGSILDWAGPEERVLDPRHATWEVQSMDPSTLHAFLEQGRHLTDAAFFAPTEWNPDVAKAPSPNTVRKVANALAKSAGGVAEEFTILAGRPANWGGGQGNPTAANTPGRGNQNRPDNPYRASDDQVASWRTIKLETDLQQIPSEQRAAVRTQVETVRSAFAELRDLPPDQRQARMQAISENPVFQEMMEQRETRRDQRRSPEQRLQRYQRYVERKKAALQSQ